MTIFFNYLNRYIPLTEEEQSIIAAKLKQRTYLKGQYILQEGDINKCQTFILSGKARTFYLDAAGQEHIVAFGIENWWVGDICSFSEQAPADFHVQCLEKTKVLQIPHQAMEELYEAVPKLERLFRLLLQKAYGNMSKRIIRNHSLSAKKRYVLFLEEYPDIAQRAPQYMIASYLGITKEFLSTIRKQMVHKPKE